jgi:hypothetical protein
MNTAGSVLLDTNVVVADFHGDDALPPRFAGVARALRGQRSVVNLPVPAVVNPVCDMLGVGRCESMASKGAHTVRRSVALPRQLVDEVLSLAPPEAAGNLNRLVAESLREFVARRKALALEAAVARMAADPAIRKECAAIAAEFTSAEMDGLRRD